MTEKVVDGQIIKGPESCIEIRSHGGAWWLHCKTCEEALADEAMKQELLNRRLGRGLQSPWFNPLKGCPVVSPSPAEKLIAKDKRSCQKHLNSGMHEFFACLADPESGIKDWREKEFNKNDQLLERLYRTQLHNIEIYGSFLQFEKKE